MKKICKGETVQQDGYIISEVEYIKILNNEKLLYWVSKKLDKLIELETVEDERPNYKPRTV